MWVEGGGECGARGGGGKTAEKEGRCSTAASLVRLALSTRPAPAPRGSIRLVSRRPTDLIATVPAPAPRRCLARPAPGSPQRVRAAKGWGRGGSRPGRRDEGRNRRASPGRGRGGRRGRGAREGRPREEGK